MVDPADEDAALADFRALTDPERRRDIDRAGEHFIVEGLLSLDALIGSRYPIRTILAAENQVHRVRGLLAAASAPLAAQVRVIVRPAPEVAALTGFAFHRGVLASAARLPPPPVAEVVRGRRTILVLEGVNDHENLGSLFRNAAAFGVDGVVLDPTTADPLYRRSVRVSLGHVLRVAWGRAEQWPRALDEMRSDGFTLLALTPAQDADPIDAVVADVAAAREASGGRRSLAILVGAEGAGLSPASLAAADRRVRIPLAPGVDSLNVATAAAIAFHRLTGVTQQSP